MLRLMIPHDFDYSSANLRDKIQYWLHKKNWKHAKLALAMGVGRNAISQLMNGSRQFTLKQIQMIADLLGIDKVELYGDFIAECFDIKGRSIPVKTTEFIKELLSNDDMNTFNQLFDHLTEEETKNIGLIFNVAESMYNEKLYRQSIYLYQRTASVVSNRLDPMLSISYFRQFMAARKLMSEDNVGVKKCKALLIVLQDYLELLPTNEKAEALIEVVVFYCLIEDYQNTLRYADRLIQFATDLIKNIRSNKQDISYLKTLISEAKMYKGFAFKGLGKYDEATIMIDSYANHNENFNKYAIGNMHLIEILKGKWNHVDLYLEQTSNDKKYAVVLPVLLEASVKNGDYDKVSDFLNKNNNCLDDINNDYTSLGLKDKLLTAQYMAEFCFHKNDFTEAIDYLLSAIELANRLQNENRLKKCWLTFTNNASHATKEQLNRFNNVVQIEM